MNSKENPEKKGMIPSSMREKRKCFYRANQTKVTAGEQKKAMEMTGCVRPARVEMEIKTGRQAGNDVIRMRCDGGCNVDR